MSSQSLLLLSLLLLIVAAGRLYSVEKGNGASSDQKWSSCVCRAWSCVVPINHRYCSISHHTLDVFIVLQSEFHNLVSSQRDVAINLDISSLVHQTAVCDRQSKKALHSQRYGLVKPSSLVDGSRRFGGTCCFQLRVSAVKIELSVSERRTIWACWGD